MGAQSLLVLVLTALLLLGADAGQNLRKTTCPLCNMDVKANINATILGDQYVYACEMAGHIDSLQNDPVRACMNNIYLSLHGAII